MAVGDWDRRELCPDGSCTGLIGPEGTCKVCGRAAPNWGDERRRGTADQDVEEEEDEDDDIVDEIAPSAPAKVGVWAERRLCSDGACVGVIGDDGKCKVCGKPGEAGTGTGTGTTDADSHSEHEHEYENEYDEDADADAGPVADADSDDEDDADEDDEDEEGDEDDEDDDDELAAAAAELAGVAPSSEVVAAEAMAGEEPERQLCPDGGCIGVIGDNGKCKICGKAAA